MSVIRSVFFYLVLIVSTFFLGIAVIITHRLTGRDEKPHLIGRLWAKINLWAAGVHFQDAIDSTLRNLWITVTMLAGVGLVLFAALWLVVPLWLRSSHRGARYR